MIFVVFALFVAISLAVLEINNSSIPFLEEHTTKSNFSTTALMGEKMSISLNDTTIEMRLDKANIATVSPPKSGNKKNETPGREFFQVFATIKNTGTQNFSFNSVPVFGVSNNNYILLAKSLNTDSDRQQAVVTTEGIILTQDMNIIDPFYELKPGIERSGYFLFESETQSVQLVINGISYKWQTMRKGDDVVGKEATLNQSIPSADQNATLSIESITSSTISNRDVELLTLKITNNSNDDISPFAYVPKFGTTIPGDVLFIENVNSEIAEQHHSLPLSDQTKLAPHTTQNYLVAFPKNVKYLFPQPPFTSDFSYIRFVL